MSIRALRKGFTMATRTKKTWVFIAIFALLTFLSITSVNNIYSFETDRLIEVRGYVVEPKSVTSEDTFLDSNLYYALDVNVKQYARGIYIVYGAVLELGPATKIGVVWLEYFDNVVYEREIPWIVTEIKPTKIISGRPLNMNEHEAIVGENFKLSFVVRETNITIITNSGAIEFKTKRGEEKVNIVGTSSEDFGKFAEKLPDIDSTSIIFITPEVYTRLRDLEVSGIDTKYVLRIIITAKGGSALGPTDALNIGEIDHNRKQIESIIEDAKGDDYSVISLERISVKEYASAVSLAVISFLVTVLIGGFYAFILVSFRKMDIATLRAIGWGSRHIRVLAIGEFMLTVFVGYIVGSIGSIITIFYYNIPSIYLSFIFAFGVVIFSMLIGLLIITRRVLGIPPMEAFRAR